MAVVRFAVGLAFLVCAVATDVRSWRIRNAAVLLCTALGLLLAGLQGGWNALADALLGMLLPLALIPLFSLSMLGAGDIKAMCALGATVGLGGSIRTVLFSFLAGGVIGLVMMICRKNGLRRLKAFFGYIRACIYQRRLLSYGHLREKSGLFRFSYGILAGYLLMILNHCVKLI